MCEMNKNIPSYYLFNRQNYSFWDDMFIFIVYCISVKPYLIVRYVYTSHLFFLLLIIILYKRIYFCLKMIIFNIDPIGCCEQFLSTQPNKKINWHSTTEYSVFR